MSTTTGPPVAAGAGALVARWRRQITGLGLRVALADGEDPRAVRAAARLRADELIEPVLVGRRQRILAIAGEAGVEVSEDVVLDHDDVVADDELTTAIAAALEGEQGTFRRSDPLTIAAAAVRCGHVDACVAGATRPTAEVLRAGLRIIGLRPTAPTLSSCFLMVLPDGRPLIFADCAVLPEPTREQLADIAVAATATYRSLVGDDPRVAMLSFSTQGSAAHPAAERVRAAARLVRERSPDVPVDGELQFDAAFVAAVAEQKAPRSAIAGSANVFVFPNLDAGNIAYKITERIGGAVALGPILQGLPVPFHDLSRGCDADGIELLAIVAAVQAAHARRPA